MIKVKNVTKKYGDFYAVRNINFEVKDNEIVGFLGRNGAGKSTTMNMITGFIEPTDGEIIVGNYSIDANPKKVKSQIGYMPEGTPLYSDLTVKEFITYMAELRGVSRKEIKKAVETAIERTGLDIVKNNLTRNLSRGYKQRVSLAGAIVGDPKIIILDEPTVGLDPKQVIEIRELIKSFGKNHTVIISSHILSEVSQLCEKVIIIDKGEIIAVDTPKNLENATANESIINVTVDDVNDKILTIKDKIDSIKEIKFIKSNEDDSKDYEIICNKKDDIRKEIFGACAKENVIILEMKEEEVSLENAFIKLVEGRPEYSQTEVRKMQYDKEIEELRQEEKEEKIYKENRKQAIKEEKVRNKIAREQKKLAKEAKKKAAKEAKEAKAKEAKAAKENDKKESDKKETKEGGDK